MENPRVRPGKKWQQPQLIILARSKPEEAVLASCKGVGGGPRLTLSSCADTVDRRDRCQNVCVDLSYS